MNKLMEENEITAFQMRFSNASFKYMELTASFLCFFCLWLDCFAMYTDTIRGCSSMIIGH